MSNAPEIRSVWVGYIRVSTHEQAERDLSLPAQRRAVEEYASRNGRTLSRIYVEEGCSGTNMNRRAFREMLEDVFRSRSDVGTIVVHHSSRFTRNATEARVVKEKFRREGVRVVSVCQETNDDPVGQLIEGIFECIDQYESEMNGIRTSAAMREAVRQGYFPGAMAPYGFAREKVEIHPGTFRFRLVPDEHETELVRQLFQLYVAGNGAKNVAMALNERGLLYRRGSRWNKDLVLQVLDEPAVAGTFFWGRRSAKRKSRNDKTEWLQLKVEPLVEPALYNLAIQLRRGRKPKRHVGRPASPALLLANLVHCGKCGATYQLETSGKRSVNGIYRYRYYNCRTFCRTGRAGCSGERIPTIELDAAVLEYLARNICTPERCDVLGTLLRRRGSSLAIDIPHAWATLIEAGSTVSRNYLLHLIERIEVRENTITIIPRIEFAMPN
jgi:site-specific DNA recombinase